MRLPALIRPSYWSLKRTIILIGSLMTLVGSLGSSLYVEAAQKMSSDLDAAVRSAEVTIEVLKNAQAEYFMFQQQGALVFAIFAANTNEEARTTLAALRQLALLDRTFAVRAIIGQLAIANQLNYRTTADQYQALIDAGRKTFNLETYTAVLSFERGLIQRSQAESADLQQRRLDLIGRKAEADHVVDVRKTVLLVLTSLGTAFLLGANLIATREEPEPDRAATAPETRASRA